MDFMEEELADRWMLEKLPGVEIRESPMFA
jgi:hypothetical protein